LIGIQKTTSSNLSITKQGENKQNGISE